MERPIELVGDAAGQLLRGFGVEIPDESRQDLLRVVGFTEVAPIDGGEPAVAHPERGQAERRRAQQQQRPRPGKERGERLSPLGVKEERQCGKRDEGQRDDHRAGEHVLERRPQHDTHLHHAIEDHRVGSDERHGGERAEEHGGDHRMGGLARSKG